VGEGGEGPKFHSSKLHKTLTTNGDEIYSSRVVIERLAVNAKVATVRSQHPPTQWNLRGGR
jgi:hypothetical protein